MPSRQSTLKGGNLMNIGSWFHRSTPLKIEFNLEYHRMCISPGTSDTISEDNIYASIQASCEDLETTKLIIIDPGIVEITDDAFSYYSELTRVILPDTVVRIGSNAFYKCTSLSTFETPPHLEVIGDFAFAETSIEDFYFPPSLTHIGEEAFAGTPLTEANIPDSVYSIGIGAFRDCAFLEAIYLPTNRMYTSISDDLCKGCISLTEIDIPYPIVDIAACAFDGCSGLQSVTFGDGFAAVDLKHIGDYAFADCTSLPEIDLTRTEAEFGIAVFEGDTALTTAFLPETTTIIPARMFHACEKLSVITTGIEINEIGDHAFANCTSLETFPTLSRLAAIGNHAFYHCAALKDFVASHSLSDIGISTFEGCESLEKADLRSHITTLPENLFNGCLHLREVQLASPYAPPRVEHEPTITEIGTGCFNGCQELEKINLPDTIETISGYAFCGCQNLQLSSLPARLIGIGPAAFQDCYSIDIRELPDHLKFLGTRCFENCFTLKRLDLGPIHILPERSFFSCKNLEIIIVHTSDIRISEESLGGCSSLMAIRIK